MSMPNHNFKDMTGLTFGNWKVLCRGENNNRKQAQWYCECLGCGDVHLISGDALRSGKSKGCKHCGNKKHGGTLNGNPIRLYRIWQSMKERTRNPKNPKFKWYGGKGISVCQDWLDYETFETWAKNNGYQDNLTIDRIDPDGNYCPENCRWITQVQQIGNIKRIPKSGYSGVVERKHKTKTSYQAIIENSRYKKYLGTYKTATEAAFARDLYLLENNLLHEHNGNFITLEKLQFKEIKQ
jgi:hypothetical protein